MQAVPRRLPRAQKGQQREAGDPEVVGRPPRPVAGFPFAVTREAVGVPVAVGVLVVGEPAKPRTDRRFRFPAAVVPPSQRPVAVAVTPDELGAAWDGGRVHLPLVSHLNGRLVGRPDAGPMPAST